MGSRITQWPMVARSGTLGSALHSSHISQEVQTAGCLLLPLRCPTHRGMVRRCRSSNRHALRIHGTCCAMPTTLATAVSRRLCKSLRRPADNPGLPCFLGFLCCSLQSISAVHLTLAEIRGQSRNLQSAYSCSSRPDCSLQVSTLSAPCATHNAHIKTCLHSPGQLVACWVQT